MEVVKAPESVTVNENFSNKNRITDSTFWSNVVLHIVYSNGEEYDVNCDGINSEGGIVPPIAEIDGYKGKIDYYISSENEDTISFYITYEYASSELVEWDKSNISAEFSAKKKLDPHSIARVEVTKLPDKVFKHRFGQVSLMIFRRRKDFLNGINLLIQTMLSRTIAKVWK
jgi:hypothetical protein